MPTRKRIRVRIDMTPMVDVAFLLLIFFMSTTQFKPPEQVAVQLPSSRSEIHVPETDTILLTINRDGDVYISTERVTDTSRLEIADVTRAVADLRSRYPRAVILLKGDKRAPFGVVSDVMDALTEANTPRFNLMTDFEPREADARVRAAG